MQHVRDFGLRTMEVDHFDPTLKHPARNCYGNMIAASRHCNGFKGQNWPSAKQEAKGLRFLNPYEEADYGDHIMEDADTGLLVGSTPAGRYHIEMLDLNADHLVQKRQDRTKLLSLQGKCAYVSGADPTHSVFQQLLDQFQKFHDEAGSVMIPPIPTVKKRRTRA